MQSGIISSPYGGDPAPSCPSLPYTPAWGFVYFKQVLANAAYEQTPEYARNQASRAAQGLMDIAPIIAEDAPSVVPPSVPGAAGKSKLHGVTFAATKYRWQSRAQAKNHLITLESNTEQVAGRLYDAISLNMRGPAALSMLNYPDNVPDEVFNALGTTRVMRNLDPAGRFFTMVQAVREAKLLALGAGDMPTLSALQKLEDEGLAVMGAAVVKPGAPPLVSSSSSSSSSSSIVAGPYLPLPLRGMVPAVTSVLDVVKEPWDPSLTVEKELEILRQGVAMAKKRITWSVALGGNVSSLIGLEVKKLGLVTAHIEPPLKARQTWIRWRDGLRGGQEPDVSPDVAPFDAFLKDDSAPQKEGWLNLCSGHYLPLAAPFSNLRDAVKQREILGYACLGPSFAYFSNVPDEAENYYAAAYSSEGSWNRQLWLVTSSYSATAVLPVSAGGPGALAASASVGVAGAARREGGQRRKRVAISPGGTKRTVQVDDSDNEGDEADGGEGPVESESAAAGDGAQSSKLRSSAAKRPRREEPQSSPNDSESEPSAAASSSSSSAAALVAPGPSPFMTEESLPPSDAAFTLVNGQKRYPVPEQKIYRGAIWKDRLGYWEAKVGYQSVRMSGGFHRTQREAAKAHDVLLLKLRGLSENSIGQLNFHKEAEDSWQKAQELLAQEDEVYEKHRQQTARAAAARAPSADDGSSSALTTRNGRTSTLGAILAAAFAPVRARPTMSSSSSSGFRASSGSEPASNGGSGSGSGALEDEEQGSADGESSPDSDKDDDASDSEQDEEGSDDEDDGGDDDGDESDAEERSPNKRYGSKRPSSSSNGPVSSSSSSSSSMDVDGFDSQAGSSANAASTKGKTGGKQSRWGYRGVERVPGASTSRHPWMARMSFLGRREKIAQFSTISAAARAYDKRNLQLRGRSAIPIINFPEEATAVLEQIEKERAKGIPDEQAVLNVDHGPCPPPPNRTLPQPNGRFGKWDRVDPDALLDSALSASSSAAAGQAARPAIVPSTGGSYVPPKPGNILRAMMSADPHKKTVHFTSASSSSSSFSAAMPYAGSASGNAASSALAGYAGVVAFGAGIPGPAGAFAKKARGASSSSFSIPQDDDSIALASLEAGIASRSGGRATAHIRAAALIAAKDAKAKSESASAGDSISAEAAGSGDHTAGDDDNDDELGLDEHQAKLPTYASRLQAELVATTLAIGEGLQLVDDAFRKLQKAGVKLTGSDSSLPEAKDTAGASAGATVISLDSLAASSSSSQLPFLFGLSSASSGSSADASGITTPEAGKSSSACPKPLKEALSELKASHAHLAAAAARNAIASALGSSIVPKLSVFQTAKQRKKQDAADKEKLLALQKKRQRQQEAAAAATASADANKGPSLENGGHTSASLQLGLPEGAAEEAVDASMNVDQNDASVMPAESETALMEPVAAAM